MRGPPPATLFRGALRFGVALGAIALLFALLSGCASPSPSPSQEQRPPLPPVDANAELPAFYLSPPVDDAKSFYGVGSGVGSDKGLVSAKAKALVDIASRLAVSVRATYSERSVLSDNLLHEYIENELESRVREREFTGYEVLESAFSNGTYFALVRVDRQRLFEDTRKSFEQLDFKLKLRFERAARGSSLEFYRLWTESESDLGQAQSMIQLLETLDSQFGSQWKAKGRAYAKWLRQIVERFERERSELVFDLQLQPGADGVALTVQELLSEEGFETRLGLPGPCDGVCVVISKHDTSHYAARRYMVTLHATFRVLDGPRVVSAARQHRVKGTALAGYAEATEAALRILRSDLAKQGILAALGL